MRSASEADEHVWVLRVRGSSSKLIIHILLILNMGAGVSCRAAAA